MLENDIISETICDKCFDEHYDRCSYCDDKFCLKSSLNEEGWCEGCVSRVGKCEDCEMPFDEEELENGFCEDCRLWECAGCEKRFEKDKNSGIYCEECDERRNCKNCGESNDDCMDGVCDDCKLLMKKAVVKCFPKILKLIEDAKKPKKIKLKILDEVYVP